jgi:hypothetical protein
MYQTGQLIWWHKFNKKIGKLKKFPYLYQMKIKFNDDNSIIEVESYKDLVTTMRKNAAFVGAKTNHEYMIGYAQRSVISKNHDIKATDETSFVEDLIKNNHIEVIKNNLN